MEVCHTIKMWVCVCARVCAFSSAEFLCANQFARDMRAYSITYLHHWWHSSKIVCLCVSLCTHFISISVIYVLKIICTNRISFFDISRWSRITKGFGTWTNSFGSEEKPNANPFHLFQMRNISTNEKRCGNSLRAK